MFQEQLQREEETEKKLAILKEKNNQKEEDRKNPAKAAARKQLELQEKRAEEMTRRMSESGEQLRKLSITGGESMRRMSKVGIGLLGSAVDAPGVYNLGRRMSASVAAGLSTEEAAERDSVPSLFSPASRSNSISGPSRSGSISGRSGSISGEMKPKKLSVSGSLPGVA